MDRRRFLKATTLAIGTLALPIPARASGERVLRLAGPWASVSYPLLWMASRPGFSGLAARIEFLPWRDPDELRLIAIEGRADFIALPSNVAANLHNRGVALQLQSISAWGLLYLVSHQARIDRLAGLGKAELGLPFRGDMPEIVLERIASAEGLDLRRDLRLRYLATPLDAIQLLLTRRIDHALLSEPAASMALARSRTASTSSIAPPLHRALDLQQAWADAGLGPARLPQAGVAALGASRHDEGLRAAFAEAHARALAECFADPAACGALVAERSGRLDPAAVADSLAHSRLSIVPARLARQELEAFLRHLLARRPGLVGGRLPADDFYAG
jgi:NitT/TauT family transport system substrate-binding protein